LLIIKYAPEHALAFDYETRKVYGVKGMNNSVSQAAHSELPLEAQMVLLPFKDVIIYDTFFGMKKDPERLAMNRSIARRALKLPVITRL
jgi:hypothetical protein